jgi:hypothetical protein
MVVVFGPSKYSMLPIMYKLEADPVPLRGGFWRERVLGGESGPWGFLRWAEPGEGACYEDRVVSAK